MPETYFITGIDTGIGKTLISAVLTEKLRADYWKPIQSGDLDKSDSLTVASLISNEQTVIFPEAYRLTQPLSPHLSAKLDGVEISLQKISLPATANNLIIEGAGGLMVPLNEGDLMIDLIKELDAEVILVSKNYLGSINHTLLSIEALKQRNIPVKGLIFCGEENEESQSYILNYSKLSLLGQIPVLKDINKEVIESLGKEITL